jgi:hypothetical protein
MTSDKLPPGIGRSVYPDKQPPFNEWMNWIHTRHGRLKGMDLGKAFEKLKDIERLNQEIITKLKQNK